MAERIALNEKVLSNVASHGKAGASWLANLPFLVQSLEDRWAIRVGRPFGNATEAYVAEALTQDGESVAIKIPIPGLEKTAREIGLLKAAGGRGYVRLLRYDEASGSMLLERLGPQLAQQALPIADQIAIICASLGRAWMKLPNGLQVVTGAEKAAEMASYISSVWPRLGKPCSERAMALGLEFAAARAKAFEPSTAVVSHGDAHAWNTLFDPKTGEYKFVDPDGWFVEPAHDLSISMREWPAALLSGDALALGQERCALMSRLTGTDFDSIWQWGFIEQLVNGLTYLDVGPRKNAAPFLAVVEAWAVAPRG